MDIDVVIPVLNRPQNASRVLESLIHASNLEVRPVFVCTKGDEAEIAAVKETEAEYIIVPWPAGDGDFAMKHNLAFLELEAPYYLVGADDLEFEPGWDHFAIVVAEHSGAGVIGTNDDANPLVKRGKHSTHPLLRRSYIEETGGTWLDGPGTIFHEGYAHQYVDTELCQAAMDRGEFAAARSSIVRHLHPMYPQRGRARTPMDDTYRKALGDASRDMHLFQERQRLSKLAEV